MFKKDLPVYIAFILMLFVAIFLLTACVGSPHSTHSLSNPSMTPLSEPDTQEPDMPTKELVEETIYGICEIFDVIGPSVAIPSIKSMGEDSGLTRTEMDSIIQFAAVRYCPEYESEVQRYYR